MMDDIHIPTRTVFTLLLAGVVLLSSAVGVLGVAPAAHGPADVADDSQLADGGAQLAFPINNVTGFHLAFPINNVTGFHLAFPINNVTGFHLTSPVDDVSFATALRDVGGTDRVAGAAFDATGADLEFLSKNEVPDTLPQDMDPY